MGTSEKIKNELKALLDEQKNLLELANDKNGYVKFGETYQIWYTRAYKVVELLGNERLEEFISYYRIDPKRKGTSIEKCTAPLNSGHSLNQDCGIISTT